MKVIELVKNKKTFDNNIVDLSKGILDNSKTMKTYIVYDGVGYERGYIKARSHNEAEKKAKKMYGEKAFVAYTEL